MPDPALIFVSYSHKDRAYKDRLATFLRILGRRGLVSHWDDGQIQASDDWRRRIADAMAQARIAVLLISADFLASDFIQDEEIPNLLARRERGELIILPVVVKPCPWTRIDWLQQLQVYPRDNATLSGAGEDHERELHYTAITEEIHRLLEDLEAGDEEVHLAPEEATEEAPAETEQPTPLELDGFFTRAGVLDLVRNSRYVEPADQILDALLLFKTARQRTWLVTTDRSMFCVLDDERTRSRDRIVQWRQPLSDIRAVKVRPRAGGSYSGLVDIGRRHNWLYSTSLHPEPEGLRGDILEMAERARQGIRRTRAN